MAKMTRSEIGHLGALARIHRHGNPATPEGRRKGGLNSIKTHKRIGGNFIVAKEHKKPKESARLAEFIGVLIGDGHLAKYQISIVTNSETDLEHASYVSRLAKKLFGITPTIRLKKNRKAVEIIISSIKLVEWLKRKEMPQGNKIAQNVCAPLWIMKNDSFKKNFIRGLFDTDGCIYTDTHIIKNKVYKNLGWTITSYSDKLRDDVFKLLQELGYKPTLNNRQVFMRRKADIEKYFQEIGSSNQKHLKRRRG